MTDSINGGRGSSRLFPTGKVEWSAYPFVVNLGVIGNKITQSFKESFRAARSTSAGKAAAIPVKFTAKKIRVTNQLEDWALVRTSFNIQRCASTLCTDPERGSKRSRDAAISFALPKSVLWLGAAMLFA